MTSDTRGVCRRYRQRGDQVGHADPEAQSEGRVAVVWPSRLRRCIGLLRLGVRPRGGMPRSAAGCSAGLSEPADHADRAVPAGRRPTTRSRASLPANSPQHSASRSWLTTAAAPTASSRCAPLRERRPTATRSCSPIRARPRSTRRSTATSATTAQGLRADRPARRHGHRHHREARVRGADPRRVDRTRPPRRGAAQLRHFAARQRVASVGGAVQGPHRRRGDDRALQGRGRAHQRPPGRPRAGRVQRIAAGARQHPGRQAPRACDHHAQRLDVAAGRADRGRGRICRASRPCCATASSLPPERRVR